MEKRDPHEILGVPHNATNEDVKRAYRRLVLKYHPDRNKSPDAKEEFQAISEAYSVLINDEERKRYNPFEYEDVDSRYNRENLFWESNFQEVFQENNGFNMFYNVPQNFAYEVEISLEDVYKGRNIQIEVPIRERCNDCNGSGAKSDKSKIQCPECKGTGKIGLPQRSKKDNFFKITTCGRCRGQRSIIKKPCEECGGSGILEKNRKATLEIPQGVNDGAYLKLTDESGSQDEINIFIKVKPHKKFWRVNSNLITEVFISFTDAVLGGMVRVPTLDGFVKLKIPKGTQTGAIFRLKGKGLPKINSKEMGDEMVKVRIKTPTKITSKQKRLLREFAKELT